MTVKDQVARGNEWYVGDQAIAQLGTPGRRAVLENRWRRFGDAIRAWLDRDVGSRQSVTILDAGCGDGNNIQPLVDIFASVGIAASIVGVDYNELRLARSRERTDASLLKTDLLNLPFGDGAFDFILCNHVIEHIPDDIGVLRELKRVLHSNGLILIGVPNEGCAFAWLRNHLLQPKILRTTDHVHFYTARSLVERARLSGLETWGDIQREGFFVPHWGVARRLQETAFGRLAMEALAAMFPGQCAGLLLLGFHAKTQNLDNG